MFYLAYIICCFFFEYFLKTSVDLSRDFVSISFKNISESVIRFCSISFKFIIKVNALFHLVHATCLLSLVSLP